MRLRRTSDVTDDHCTKVYICQDDGPYGAPIKVELTDIEFVMGDIPVSDTVLTFDLGDVQADRLITLSGHTRLSHISLLITNPGTSTFEIDGYAKYPDDTATYLVSTGTSLSAAQTTNIMQPSQILIFPEGTSLVLDCRRLTGTDTPTIKAHFILAPAVI